MRRVQEGRYGRQREQQQRPADILSRPTRQSGQHHTRCALHHRIKRGLLARCGAVSRSGGRLARSSSWRGAPILRASQPRAVTSIHYRVGRVSALKPCGLSSTSKSTITQLRNPVWEPCRVTFIGNLHRNSCARPPDQCAGFVQPLPLPICTACGSRPTGSPSGDCFHSAVHCLGRGSCLLRYCSGSLGGCGCVTSRPTR